MTGRHATPRLGLYSSLAAALLVAAVISGRPELAALGAPVAIALVVGLAGSAPLDHELRVTLAPTQATEGEVVTVTVTVTAHATVPWLEVGLASHAAFEPLGPSAVAVAVRAGERTSVTFELRCLRWGVHRPCRVTARAYSAGRLFVDERSFATRAVLRVYPHPLRFEALVRPARLQALTGAHVSRERGSGIEFADARPFVAGDRIRAVNWRASARRGTLWVNDRHPDRNADVVLFVDTFAAAGRGLDSTLDLAVEAAFGLANRHIAANDRVGLVGLGGVLRWLPPGMGVRQLHRIVAAVLDSEVIASEAEKGIDVIPVRGLPPRATVVALTPLLDRRAIALMVDLRARGFDLAVLECSPLPYMRAPMTPREALARRLWLLERDSVREQLRGAGAALVEWHEGTPLVQVLQEVGAWRRLALARVAR